MSEEQGKSARFERIVLIIVSALLVIALLYIGVSAFARRGQDAPPPDAAPAVPTEEPPAAAMPTEPPAGAVDTTSAPVVDAGATSTPRRLALKPTPTPLTLSDEDDPRAILDLSNPDHFDYFDNPDAWFDYDSEGFAAYSIQDGRLHGKDYDPVNMEVYWSFNAKESGNVYAEISATNGDCIGRDAVGLTIRIDTEQAPSGYALEVSCDGAWRLILYRPGGRAAEILTDWTPSDAIHQGLGATNRLGIWGYLGKFYLFVNGFQVGENFEANYSWTYGVFAAYVRSSQTYDLTAQFDDFAYWNIPYIP